MMICSGTVGRAHPFPTTAKTILLVSIGSCSSRCDISPFLAASLHFANETYRQQEFTIRLIDSGPEKSPYIANNGEQLWRAAVHRWRKQLLLRSCVFFISFSLWNSYRCQFEIKVKGFLLSASGALDNTDKLFFPKVLTIGWRGNCGARDDSGGRTSYRWGWEGPAHG